MKKKSSKAKRERKPVEQKSRKRSEKRHIFRRKREVKAEENVENQEKTEALLTADKWKERKQVKTNNIDKKDNV